MAIKPEIWAKAKVEFEGGKTLTEISFSTGIDKSTISKKAKSDGWQKGKNQQLIIDEARVLAEKSTLNQQELNFHNQQVSERTKHLQFIHNMTLKNLSVLGKKIDETFTPQDHKLTQEAINKGGEALGVIEKNSTVINNTNQQANITDNEKPTYEQAVEYLKANKLPMIDL